MSLLYCRLFYALALLCGLILLYPTPGTIFMAICFSCLSIPLYRHFKWISIRKTKKLKEKKNAKIKLFLLRRLPFALYAGSLALAILVPISILCLLVAPQATRGLEQLKSLDLGTKLNLLMPDNLRHFANTKLPSLNDYPALESIVNDITTNAEEYFTLFLGDIFTPTALWQKATAFLGGSLTVLWTFILFFTLTCLFTLYAKQTRVMLITVLGLPLPVIRRFTIAIRRALNAILLGVCVVALIQGFLCGLAFAVAGIESWAFWGLMAAFVAPIPMIGTALVWGPLALVLWFKGAHIAAFGLTIWGVIVVAGVDNICRPFFLQQGIRAPFFVLILAMICGTSVFGPIGVVAGPILLATSLQLIAEAHDALVRIY